MSSLLTPTLMQLPSRSPIWMSCRYPNLIHSHGLITTQRSMTITQPASPSQTSLLIDTLHPDIPQVSQVHIQSWTHHHCPPASATTHMLPLLRTLSWSSFSNLSSYSSQSQRTVIIIYLSHSLKIHMQVVTKSYQFSLLNLKSAHPSPPSLP